MNKTIVSGRLGNDVTYYPAKANTKACARFSVAIDHRKDTPVTFIPVVAFGKNADVARDFLTKGKRCIFTTHVQPTYNKEGKTTGLEFVMDEVDFV